MPNKEEKQKNNSKAVKRFLWIGFFGLVALFLLATWIRFLFTEKLSIYQSGEYAVQGVDVSYYQGEIDWEVLGEQIDFAFMKATEGSSHTDLRFEENRSGALENDVICGAYHFFSFESSGETQAENFIRVVGSWDGMLPPVVDVEYYSVEEAITVEEEQIREELRRMLLVLEEYYGVKPIIYATLQSYYSILDGEFDDYPLWIRNTYFAPTPLIPNWDFWQYCDEGELAGYGGESRYIDLNVYAGTREELDSIRIWQ